jgi:phage repressor protein C with HTH and peptisase S24 domain
MSQEPRFEISRRWLECVDLLIKRGYTVTYRAFCESIGVAPQSLNDIKSERRAVTLDMVYATCNTYPVGLNYLMRGTGQQLTPENVEENVEVIVDVKPKDKINPTNSPLQSATTEIIVATQDTTGNPTYTVINHKAAANYLNGYQSQEYYESLGVVTLPRSLVGSKKQGVFFQIEGDSMTPKFQHGDWVACTLLDRSEWHTVHDLDCYVVVSSTYGIQFKRIKNRLESLGIIRCKSDNRRHRAYNIEEDNLLQLFRFVLHVSPDASNPEDALYQKVDHLEDTTTDLREMMEQLQEQMLELKGGQTHQRVTEKAH